MPPALTPHTMVALMAKVVSANHDHVERYRKLKGSAIIGGMLEDDEGIKRTFPILDALANICVSKEKHQVVAVAFQLMIEERKIRLMIAENGPVTESIDDYLHRIWKHLQELGSEFSARREQDNKDENWVDYKGPSPGMPVGVGTNTRLTIFRRIYEYTQDKTRNRKERSWPGLVNFMSKLKLARGGKLIGWELELNTVYRALRRAYKFHDLIARIKYRDLDHWRNLHALLEGASQRVKQLTENDYLLCKEIAAFVGMLFLCHHDQIYRILDSNEVDYKNLMLQRSFTLGIPSSNSPLNNATFRL